MRALVEATHRALNAANISGEQIAAIALDTTGSSVIPVGEGLVPLDDYYLWCDHRAKNEAAEITEVAHREGLKAIEWCGGMYSSEWGFAKLLHWLRHNPAKLQKFASAFEHCDMVAATLCGITDPKHVRRSVCAMGHKWLWNSDLGGLPPESFLAKVDPLFTGVRGKLEGECALSDQIAGRLSPSWAEKLGLRAGIPIPVGALDAHWDAIGAGAREGDVVNVVGTSTCINGGGIPQNNPVLNQVYANVLGRPVLVPSSKVTGIGSAIFAFLAAGTFRSIEECQDQICPEYTEFTPQPEEREIYDELYALFRRMYFDFGKPFRDSCFGDVLPKLIQMARVSRVPQ